MSHQETLSPRSIPSNATYPAAGIEMAIDVSQNAIASSTTETISLNHL
jgi:hypothetical protein